MSGTEKGFGVFNDVLGTNKRDLEHLGFPRFSSLPQELRLEVWEQALRQDRLVTVTLAIQRPRPGKRGRHPAPPAYTTKNELGNQVSGCHYQLRFSKSHKDSPLLSASRESRQAARKYYRIRMPLRPGTVGRVLYLNPDHDIVCVRNTKVSGQVFADFLHDVRSHDPKSVGVSQLAMVGGIDMDRLIKVVPGELAPAAAESFRRTLLGLRRFIAIKELAEESRTMLGVLNVRGAFRLYDTDPRAVGPDLARMTSRQDPRDLRQQWGQLETNFNCHCRPCTGTETSSSSGCEFLYALAASPREGREEMDSRASLGRYLAKEHASWRGFTNRFDHRYDEDHDLREKLRDAAGFWLFPADAFDAVPSSNFRPGPPQVFDMSGHHPALALFQL